MEIAVGAYLATDPYNSIVFMDFSDLDKFLFPPMTGWLFALKIFLILFNIGTILFIIYVWLTTIYMKRLFWWDLKEFLTMRAFQIRRIDKEWRKIKRRLLTKNEAEYKLAVIEADLLVSDTFGRLGFIGATLGEKLGTQATEILSDLDAVKEADQLYQNLIDDPSFSLNYEQSKRAILSFEQGLKDVHAFTEK
jgi:hypothetical protein